MSKRIAAGFAVLGLGMGAAHADSDKKAKDWYVAPMVGGVLTDGDELHVGGVASIAIGKKLNKRWNVEVSYSTSEVDVENDVEWKKSGAGISALYFFDRADRYHPFAIGAVNALDSEIGTDQSDALGLDLGVGAIRQLHEWPFDLRAEVRYRLDFHGDSSQVNGDVFYDWTAQLGAMIPFGGKPCVCEDKPEEKAPVLPSVYFALDSAQLTARAKAQLNAAARLMEENSDIDAVVAGHADDTGPLGYNQKLSERRAASVRNYLLGKGVSSDRLVAQGFGETSPAASNKTESGRKQNRRVELSIRK